ncbi:MULTISPECIES: hypothetical protein [Sphingobacterium]|uniref:hypothetical protein n=1 Tax=Sphingobacterium TaxID=28453 RepID=UPI00104468B4|nr:MULTISPECIES: hypothetical protein [Sphingobacterium]MCW2258612.1 hypothetical protein [Sphingobacterium kitahiroshimense]TCR14931.1 hypothetical protein EDF67_1011038 [Sphingobacterium sp. JUb78]
MNKYLEKVVQLQSEHRDLKTTIQNAMDILLQELRKIYDQNQEYLNVGIPLIESMNIIVAKYQILSKIDTYFISYDDPEILFIKEALFALCETWFKSVVLIKDDINFGFSAFEIQNVSQTLLQFLRDTGIDLDSLLYSEHLNTI